MNKIISIPGNLVGISVHSKAEAEEIRRQAAEIVEAFTKEEGVPFETGDKVHGLMGWATVIDHKGLMKAIERGRDEVFYIYPNGKFGNNPVKTARQWTNAQCAKELRDNVR